MNSHGTALIVGLVLFILATGLAVEAQQPPPTTHDPFQGMDRSGRTPKVPLPADLPERWRYLPEGRIKPGNIFERFLVSSFVAPQRYWM